MRLGGPDDIKPVQVCLEALGASPDGAQRAKQVFFAETSPMQAHQVKRVIVPKRQIIPTGQDLLSHGLMLWDGSHILSHIESALLCFAVTTDLTW